MKTNLLIKTQQLAGKIAIGVCLAITAIGLLWLSLQTAKSDDPPAAASPSVVTDQADYAPGTTANITGSGFSAGEIVALQVLHHDGTPSTGEDHQPWLVVADANGGFATTWHVCEDDCVGSTLLLSAVGDSGSSAQTTFTDAPPPDGTGTVSVTANNGSCLAFTAAVGGGPDNWEVAQGGSYTMTISGVTECTGDTITVFVQSSSSGNFCFNATGGSGTYVGTVTIPNPACNTMPISYKCGASAACNNSGTYNAKGPSGASSVHFRASNFDASCNRLSTDTNCDPNGSCPPDKTAECDGTLDPAGAVVVFSLPNGAISSSPASGSFSR